MRCNRLVLIGLDGVPYTLLNNLADKGIMPNTADIIKRGVFKKINSTLPEVSAVAWSSIITGKNPGEHGIFGFTDIDRQTYRLRFPDFNDLKAPPFWARFPNLKYVIINVPSTYPAMPLNGILISGFVSPDIRKAVYPKSLLPTLKRFSYKIDVDSEKAHENMDSFIEDLSATLESSVGLYRHLWKVRNWDAFMFVVTATDRLMHFLWDAYEDEGHKYHKAFLDYFKKIDKMIGETKADLKKADALLIFSDHGFEKLGQDAYVNAVLEKEGLLESGLNGEITNLTNRTRAFALDPGRIYIHKKGRYVNGSVPADEEKALLAEIEGLFGSLASDGRRVIQKIYRKESLYSGKYLDSASDLVLLPRSGFNLKAKLTAGGLSSNDIFTGRHSYEGAFFLAGNDEGQLPNDSSVIDIGLVIEKVLKRRCSISK